MARNRVYTVHSCVRGCGTNIAEQAVISGSLLGFGLEPGEYRAALDARQALAHGEQSRNQSQNLATRVPEQADRFATIPKYNGLSRLL